MGIKAGISYEVLRALALQQGHVVLVSYRRSIRRQSSIRLGQKVLSIYVEKRDAAQPYVTGHYALYAAVCIASCVNNTYHIQRGE